MKIAPSHPGLFPLALLSVIAGAGAGLICGLFRVALGAVDALRLALPAMWSAEPLRGCLLMMGIAGVATAFSAFLARRLSPAAPGSGIPHIEAVIEVQLPPAPFVLVPIKFIGGLLAIGSGLALGREGPCVQMGATLAHLMGAGAIGRTGGRCSRRAPAPASPPPSTRRSPARCSYWRSCCGDLKCATPSRRSAHR